jgi:hypothetical protein
MSIAVSIYISIYIVSIASAFANWVLMLMLRADTYHWAPAARGITFQTRPARLSPPAYIEKGIVAERRDGFGFATCSVWFCAWMGG